MRRGPPRSTSKDTLFPYTTLGRVVGNGLLLDRIACREVIEVAASDIGIIGVQLQYAGLKLELLRRADARGPLGSLRDRLARPIHFDQLATDQLILEPASFLVTRMQIGDRKSTRLNSSH